MEDYSQQTAYQLKNEAWNRYVLECKELLETLKHLLKGEVMRYDNIDDKGELVEVEVWECPDDQEPPINAKGYHQTIFFLQALLDKSLATGNLTLESASVLVNANMKDLVAVYRTNFKEYGFKSISEAHSICSIMTAQLYNHFSKSIEMGLIKQLASQYSITENSFKGMPKQDSNLSV